MILAIQKERFDIVKPLVNKNINIADKNLIISNFLADLKRIEQKNSNIENADESDKKKNADESDLDEDNKDNFSDNKDSNMNDDNKTKLSEGNDTNLDADNDTNLSEDQNSNLNDDNETDMNEEVNDIDENGESIFGEDENNEVANEEEFVEFNDDDDCDEIISNSSQINAEDDMFISKLMKEVNFCRAYFIDFEFDDLFSSMITIRIPTSILPISVSEVNGFYNSPYLVECKFNLNEKDTYAEYPKEYEFTNPSYGSKFPGSVLLKNRFRNFFKLSYEPQVVYKCQNYVLAPEITTDQSKINERVACLVDEGFSEKAAKKALLFCSYDLDQARDFLITGLLQQRSFPIPVSYTECPLFYLILEMCEAFFDMEDSCCVCGRKLGVFNLKPACCNQSSCQFSFVNLGVGSNIIGEIKRDPLATDFIIALAGAAFKAPANPPVFDPSPESQNIYFNESFFETLPSMKQICNQCNTDSDLIRLIGINSYEILRFFILANKAQLITLPSDLQTSVNVNSTQFLITSVSPESELIFREKREKFGVKWFWHGSHAERWYRILHTGLKDLGRTDYQLNGGPWYGDGIYMSDSFSVSLSYCTPACNIYKNSKLPKNMYVISLVENADVKELSGPVAPNEYTQKDDSACITRVLFLIDNKSNYIDFNTLQNPPKVPSLPEVLSHQIKKYI